MVQVSDIENFRDGDCSAFFEQPAPVHDCSQGENLCSCTQMEYVSNSSMELCSLSVWWSSVGVMGKPGEVRRNGGFPSGPSGE